jgi:hypothetical protein
MFAHWFDLIVLKTDKSAPRPPNAGRIDDARMLRPRYEIYGRKRIHEHLLII